MDRNVQGERDLEDRLGWGEETLREGGSVVERAIARRSVAFVMGSRAGTSTYRIIGLKRPVKKGNESLHRYRDHSEARLDPIKHCTSLKSQVSSSRHRKDRQLHTLGRVDVAQQSSDEREPSDPETVSKQGGGQSSFCPARSRSSAAHLKTVRKLQ